MVYCKITLQALVEVDIFACGERGSECQDWSKLGDIFCKHVQTFLSFPAHTSICHCTMRNSISQVCEDFFPLFSPQHHFNDDKLSPLSYQSANALLVIDSRRQTAG